jgi:cell wall-associated NlpC family hydrolase
LRWCKRPSLLPSRESEASSPGVDASALSCCVGVGARFAFYRHYRHGVSHGSRLAGRFDGATDDRSRDDHAPARVHARWTAPGHRDHAPGAALDAAASGTASGTAPDVERSARGHDRASAHARARSAGRSTITHARARAPARGHLGARSAAAYGSRARAAPASPRARPAASSGQLSGSGTRGAGCPDRVLRELAGQHIPYVFGGKTLAGLDCSGFVWYVLNHVGHPEPYRMSGELKAWAKSIPASAAVPGDLVFYPGHVAIFVGNGRIIDAGSSVYGVTERALWPGATFGRIPDNIP